MLIPAAFQNKCPEISVWLDDSDDEIEKKFHCLVCGKTVFEYCGNVRIIIAGKHYDKRPKIVQCNNIVIMDSITRQVANISSEDFTIHRDRYFKIKCRTKYWIS